MNFTCLGFLALLSAFSWIGPQSKKTANYFYSSFYGHYKMEEPAEQPAELSLLSLFTCHQYYHFAS